MPKASKKTVKAPAKKNIKQRATSQKSFKQKIISIFPSKMKYDEVKSLKLWLILVAFLLLLGLILSNLYWSQNLKAFSSACSFNDKPISFNKNISNIESNIPGSCLELGGKLKMAMRGDNERYRICVLPNGNECDNQALFEGVCPSGGVSVTENLNSSLRYCLINGGNLDESSNSCIFLNGSKCAVDDYYNGKCLR